MFHRRMHPDPFARLRTLLAAEPDLEFAVLVGSRAAGTNTAASDWDIALQWHRDLDWMDQLGRTETLRRRLAEALAVPETAVDLIDAPRANLAMRAAIAEEGVVLAGEDHLPWQRFLRRTWRELERKGDRFIFDAVKNKSVPFSLMRTDLYHAETLRIAAAQSALLDEARARLLAGASLTPLEQNGLLHAVQVLVENAIGKAKQELKARGETVPVSAYDAFAALARVGCLPADSLPAWNAVIGLRNRIVHDYMNVDMVKIFEFLRAHGDRPVLDFLRAPLPDEPGVR